MNISREFLCFSCQFALINCKKIAWEVFLKTIRFVWVWNYNEFRNLDQVFIEI